MENQHKASIHADAQNLLFLDKFIGHLPLESVHMGSLQNYIQFRQKDGVKNRAINYCLQVIRRILNLAATECLDEFSLTWLHVAPKIKLLSENDKRKPYPLSWQEQEKLLGELPLHLRGMMLFAVNTGCRDQEICNLRWNWEMRIGDIYTAFLIPGNYVKNREDRLVVLNKEPSSVIEEVRHIHQDFCFYLSRKTISANA